MNRNVIITVVILCLLPVASFSQDMTATEIVQKANDIINQETVFAKMKNFVLFKFSGV